MRHRRFITAQAAFAGFVAIVAMCSYVSVPTLIVRLSAGNSLVLATYEGRGRIFFLQSEEPMLVSQNLWGPGLLLRSEIYAPPLPAGIAGPYNEKSFLTRITLGGRRDVGPFGGTWRSQMFRPPPSPSLENTPKLESTFLRFPLWPVAIILMYVPVRRAILERRVARRRSQNECVGCGYSLFGLTSARCPECGLAI